MNKRMMGILVSVCTLMPMKGQQKDADTMIGTGNPYLPLWEHVPDGEPRVFEDPDNPGKYRVYIIGSHDVRFNSYCGSDIREWSAPVEDLTQWRDEGPIFTYHVDDQWDVMYAPDLVEIRQQDGTKVYYLYPHSRGPRREAMVCKGTRPDGPFTPVNLSEDGRSTIPGSFLGFDPSIFVETITDPKDPDYGIGFRAYGYWGFQRSSAAQLDQATMYSVRPGTDIIPYFIPACVRYGGPVREPQGTTYPALFSDQRPGDFNFFEASSIRQVGNKYVMIFSGHSGPDYGLGSTNSTLRYAYGDSPMGPWRSGGVLVDSRGVVPNEDGTRLEGRNAAHNTHGSLQEVNGQWYVFYHRPPRGFGFARQAMVAPVTIRFDKKPVAEGGRVEIFGYDPYAKDGIWKAAASNGDTYTGAEVTSEGFQIFGLPPYRYYSAGYACYLSNNGAMQDSWDIWDNHMDVIMKNNDIVGFKYFGFGGLKKPTKGIQPFEGTKPGNGTTLQLFLVPQTSASFKLSVWMDGPWDNATWKGRKLGEVLVPAGAANKVTKLSLDVSAVVDKADKKHAIYLVAEGEGADQLCVLKGLGFSRKGLDINYPEPPTVSICVNGRPVELPTTPVRSTNANGLTSYDQYEAIFTADANASAQPQVTATSANPEVRTDVKPTAEGQWTVTCTYRGMTKTYTLKSK